MLKKTCFPELNFSLNFSGEKKAAERLLDMIDLTNQTVGDAFSDVLLVETVLNAKGWNLADWEKIYSDLPNRQLKVTIKVNQIVLFLI